MLQVRARGGVMSR